MRQSSRDGGSWELFIDFDLTNLGKNDGLVEKLAALETIGDVGSSSLDVDSRHSLSDE